MCEQTVCSCKKTCVDSKTLTSTYQLYNAVLLKGVIEYFYGKVYLPFILIYLIIICASVFPLGTNLQKEI